MAIILSIETATDVCSVALSENDKIIDSVSITERNVHSAKLASMTGKLMQSNKMEFTKLEAVAVSMGPGSFTGLRIGISVAKGIAYGLEIPIIGINTLQSIALAATSVIPGRDFLFCPVIDARNNEVYYALYDANNNEIQPADAGIIGDQTFKLSASDVRILFAGPAVNSNTIVKDSVINSDILPDVYPDAIWIARLAAERFLKKDFDDITYFEPFYLRDFKARNLSTRIHKVINEGKK